MLLELTADHPRTTRAHKSGASPGLAPTTPGLPVSNLSRPGATHVAHCSVSFLPNLELKHGQGGAGASLTSRGGRCINDTHITLLTLAPDQAVSPCLPQSLWQKSQNGFKDRLCQRIRLSTIRQIASSHVKPISGSLMSNFSVDNDTPSTRRPLAPSHLDSTPLGNLITGGLPGLMA